MAYNILKVLDANFIIKNENKNKAVQALYKLIKENENYKFYKYIIEKNITCFEDIMKEFQWDVKNNENNDIFDIYLYEENEDDDIYYLYGESRNDNYEIFKVLAPYIEPNSFIQVLGKDYFTWKLCFNGQFCTRIGFLILALCAANLFNLIGYIMFEETFGFGSLNEKSSIESDFTVKLKNSRFLANNNIICFLLLILKIQEKFINIIQMKCMFILQTMEIIF